MNTRKDRTSLSALAKLAALVAGVVLSSMQIWDMVRAPHSSLRADVRFSDYAIPTFVHYQLKELRSLDNTDYLDRSLNLEKWRNDYIISQPPILDEAQAEKILAAARDAETTKEVIRHLQEEQENRTDRLRDGITQLTQAFRELIRARLLKSLLAPTAYLSSVWYFDIENTGDLVAQNVRLRAPNAKVAEITREGKPQEEVSVNEFISLGTIEPREVVSIVAWSEGVASEFKARDIRLTHSTGIGSVNVYESIGPFWGWLSRWWIPLVLLLLWPIAIVLQARSRPAPRAANGSHTNDTERDEGAPQSKEA